MGALAAYLLLLAGNASAYEEHRAWRHDVGLGLGVGMGVGMGGDTISGMGAGAGAGYKRGLGNRADEDTGAAAGGGGRSASSLSSPSRPSLSSSSSLSASSSLASSSVRTRRGHARGRRGSNNKSPYSSSSPLLRENWHCRVCRWAASFNSIPSLSSSTSTSTVLSREKGGGVGSSSSILRGIVQSPHKTIETGGSAAGRGRGAAPVGVSSSTKLLVDVVGGHCEDERKMLSNLRTN